MTEKSSIETPEMEPRIGVARHKPCDGGCGRSWDEAGGGWMYFGGDGQLEAKWKCDACDPSPPQCTGCPEGCPSCYVPKGGRTDGDSHEV